MIVGKRTGGEEAEGNGRKRSRRRVEARIFEVKNTTPANPPADLSIGQKEQWLPIYNNMMWVLSLLSLV